MTVITKICKDRQEQVDLINKYLHQQPDYEEGMDIAPIELGNGESEWRGNPVGENSTSIYARVLQECLPRFELKS